MSEIPSIERITDFALSVLLGGDGRQEMPLRRIVHYGPEETAPSDSRLVILPSGFLEAAVSGRGSVPELPLAIHQGLPVLFGRPGVHTRSDRIVLNVDVVAATLFLLTRYEEVLRPDVRDEHGRFPGQQSLLGRAGFVDRPIVDEYGRLVRNLLRKAGVDQPSEIESIRRIFLTHDMDRPFVWHQLRNVVSEVGRRVARLKWTSAHVPVLTYLGLKGPDPHDSFDWIIEHDNRLVEALGAEQVKVIHFVMSGGTSSKDGRYNVRGRLVKNLLRRLLASGAELGLHPSYEAGLKPHLVKGEAEALRMASGQPIEASRHHYLCWRNIQDYQGLVESGIKHDFTMGYSDLAGFRLGTSRSFCWFDPIKCEQTELHVHPTIIEEGTLDRKTRMNLDYDQALAHCNSLIESTRRHNGDLTLLWHNSELTDGAVARGRYHRRLYETLLESLASTPRDGPRSKLTEDC